jgi:uncharacterized membrane protein
MYVSLVLTFFIMVIVDTLYLSSSDFYPQMFGPILRHNIDIPTGLIAWVLLTFGIYTFVNKYSTSYSESFINGLLFGLVVYGVYNFTNYATIEQWSYELLVRDTLWGMFLTGSMAVVMNGLARTIGD